LATAVTLGHIDLRLAGPSDATAISRLDGSGPGTLRRWNEALSLAPGDDHFVLAALDEDGRLVGFASAGGSRDPHGKGDGELYSLRADPSTRVLAVCAELVVAVLERLTAAGYARAICWVEQGTGGEETTRRALGDAGFSPTSSTAIGPGERSAGRQRRLTGKRHEIALCGPDARPRWRGH